MTSFTVQPATIDHLENAHNDLNVCINSANDASISCINFVNFGPVTPEKMVLIYILFYDMAKKLAYLVKYLRKYWTDFYNLFTV